MTWLYIAFVTTMETALAWLWWKSRRSSQHLDRCRRYLDWITAQRLDGRLRPRGETSYRFPR